MLQDNTFSSCIPSYLFFSKLSDFSPYSYKCILYPALQNFNIVLSVASKKINNIYQTVFVKLWSLHKFTQYTCRQLPNKKKIIFSRYFYNGLGYKMFVHQNNLFVWVGLTHYTIIPIPRSIHVFAKKKRVYFITKSSFIDFKNFLIRIRKIRKIDIYKGKGLLEVKTYKGFIKMKSGKKKQY